MKEIEKSVNVYVANDGTEFLDKAACEIYEKNRNAIKYFMVKHAPDLTETGMFMRDSVVAVYDERHGCHLDIVRKWCVETKGYPILSESVQGCGWQRGFEIITNAKEQWDKFQSGAKVSEYQSWTFPTFDEKVFLSPIEVDGFPKPFNYVEEWNLKG